MSTVPSSGTFDTDDTLTQGELRTALEDVRDVVAEIAGSGDASGEQALTIATGVVTPAAGRSRFLRIDTEGAAATDILDTIAQTNVPDQALVFVRIADNARVVTVNHNAGGTGQISLSGSIDLELNQTTQVLMLRRSGTSYMEVARFGREKEHSVGGAGEPAFGSGWAAAVGNGPRFWKDETGIVHFVGQATGTSVADGSTIWTMPAGYRPLNGGIWVPAFFNDNGTLKIASVKVAATTGVVTLQNVPAGNPGASCTLTLDSVSYRAEA